MARRKRQFSTFSLSFLDIMSCGFGAVALVFLMIKHGTDQRVEMQNQALFAEVNRLEEEIKEGEEQQVRVRNTLSDVDQQLAEAQGLARRINERITSIQQQIENLDDTDSDQQLAALREELEAARQEREDLERQAQQRGNDVRRFVGDGQRQYLTGLKLGGNRVLILVDSSASMLDATLVNIIRKRNMDDEVKKASHKWRQAIGTVEWLVANLPPQASYQIYSFNTDFRSVISNTEGQWLSLQDRNQLERGISNLQQLIPGEGTSLARVFISINGFEQKPDNIYLITDGLPTQGLKPPKRNVVSGKERLDLFADAVDLLPQGVPINTILLPMEGDWMAAAEFWKLAQLSRGAFLTPSEDWP